MISMISTFFLSFLRSRPPNLTHLPQEMNGSHKEPSNREPVEPNQQNRGLQTEPEELAHKHCN